MHINWFTLVLQLLNFAVLVYLLQRFLYRPVLRMIDARRAAIAQQYAQAQAAQSSAQERLAALEAQRLAIANERAAALKAAAADAERQQSVRRAQAEQEAKTILDEAHKQVAQERTQLLAEAHTAAFELAAQLTRRLFAMQPASVRTDAWLEQIEQHLRGLSATERAELSAQLRQGASLTVVTALALERDVQQRWRTRLEAALGAPIRTEYAADPGLIAGVELHFPQATLSFSLASALAALRRELQIDADAH